jgi:hypothetical protein
MNIKRPLLLIYPKALSTTSSLSPGLAYRLFAFTLKILTSNMRAFNIVSFAAAFFTAKLLAGPIETNLLVKRQSIEELEYEETQLELQAQELRLQNKMEEVTAVEEQIHAIDAEIIALSGG